MEIGECNAQVASSNIHSNYKSVFSVWRARSRLLIPIGTAAE